MCRLSAISGGAMIAESPVLLRCRPLSNNFEPEKLFLERQHGAGQNTVGEIIGRQWKIGRFDAELQREIKRCRRLAAARNADEYHLRLAELAGRRAVVVRLREVDRLHASEILMAVGDALTRWRRAG